jgi:hypothetical protein
MTARKDGKYYVVTGGCKMTKAAFAGIAGTTPAAITAMAAAFDELVFVTSDPSNRAKYTFVGRSHLNDELMAHNDVPGFGPMPVNTADLLRDGDTYIAVVTDAAGTVHKLTSTDMLAWTYGANLGVPAGTSGIKSPSVIKSGNTLHVWANRFSAPGVEDNTLWYAKYNGTTWTAAAQLTFDGVADAEFSGHPFVTSDGVAYTLTWVKGGGGITRATASMDTPTEFHHPIAIYDDAAKSEGNVCVGSYWICYTTYTNPDALGWAFADVKAYTTATFNSKSVQFFGCSHMNNEQNYVYRKLIANFGTTNVEHQARI